MGTGSSPPNTALKMIRREALTSTRASIGSAIRCSGKLKYAKYGLYDKTKAAFRGSFFA